MVWQIVSVTWLRILKNTSYEVHTLNSTGQIPSEFGIEFYNALKFKGIFNPLNRFGLSPKMRKGLNGAESAAREFLKLAKIKIEDATVVLPDSNLPASLARIAKKK